MLDIHILDLSNSFPLLTRHMYCCRSSGLVEKKSTLSRQKLTCVSKLLFQGLSVGVERAYYDKPKIKNNVCQLHQRVYTSHRYRAHRHFTCLKTITIA